MQVRSIRNTALLFVIFHSRGVCVCVCVCALSHVRLLAASRTIACPGSSAHGIFQAGKLE